MLQDPLTSNLYKQNRSFKKGAPQYIGPSKDFRTLLSYNLLKQEHSCCSGTGVRSLPDFKALRTLSATRDSILCYGRRISIALLVNMMTDENNYGLVSKSLHLNDTRFLKRMFALTRIANSPLFRMSRYRYVGGERCCCAV